jgi:hypothetical protein
MAAAPVLLAYAVLLRPDVCRKLLARGLVYFVGLCGLVVAYLLATAHTSPALGFHWSEVPLAVCFLASVGVVVWALDRLANALLSAAFRLPRGARRPAGRYVPKTVLRVLLTAALTTPYLAAAFTTHWVRFTDRTDPRRWLGAGCRQVRFESTDGVPLAGWFVPADRASDATVILVPGRAQLRASTLSYARMLREGGCNVFFFDYLGSQGTAGHTRGLGVLQARAVLGAVAYLRGSRPEASRYVFGFGISDGAAGITLAAARDRRIQAVVLDSAFWEDDPILGKLVSLLPRPIGNCFRGATLLLASAGLGCDLFEADLERNVRRIAPRPVLLVHGLADAASPAANGRRAYARARGPVGLWLVPNARHGDSPLWQWREYRDRVQVVFESVRCGVPAFPPRRGG